MQFLRHVADAQARRAAHVATLGLEQAEYHAHQGGLAGAIGADQGDDLAGPHAELHVVQHGLAVEADRDPVETDQGVVHALPLQPAHRPTTSTVWLSTAKPTPAAPSTMAWLMAGCSSSVAAWQLRQIRN